MSVFNTSSTATAKFEHPGATVAGTVTEVGEPRQATEFGKNEPATWPSGDPIMQVAITLQTDERDPEDPEDEGLRRLYVTVSGKEGGQLWAIKQAIRAAGGKDLEVGARLAVRFTGTDPASKNPANPRKLYAAQYQLPPAGGGLFTTTEQGTVNTGTGELQQGWPAQQAQQPAAGAQAVAQQLGGTPVTPATPAAAQQPPTPQPAPAGGGVDLGLARQLLALGLQDAQIAGTLGCDPAVVAALRNMPPA